MMHFEIGNKACARAGENDESCQWVHFLCPGWMWNRGARNQNSALTVSQDSPTAYLSCLNRSMTNLIVLGISCASEQPIWYFLPQTVTFHQRTDFILSSCSFWAHWSSTPASCSHSRSLFCHPVPLNPFPSLPHSLLKIQVLISVWEFRAWWALLSLSIWCGLDGLISCWFKCIRKEKENL